MNKRFVITCIWVTLLEADQPNLSPLMTGLVIKLPQSVCSES